MKEFIESKGLTIQEFEQLCGLSNGYVNNIRKMVGAKSLEKILEQFPEINADWLNFGVVEETTVDSNVAKNIGGNNTQNSDMVIEALANQLNIKDRQIEEQQRLTAKSQEQIDRLLSIIERMNLK